MTRHTTGPLYCGRRTCASSILAHGQLRICPHHDVAPAIDARSIWSATVETRAGSGDTAVGRLPVWRAAPWKPRAPHGCHMSARAGCRALHLTSEQANQLQTAGLVKAPQGPNQAGATPADLLSPQTFTAVADTVATGPRVLGPPSVLSPQLSAHNRSAAVCMRPTDARGPRARRPPAGAGRGGGGGRARRPTVARRSRRGPRPAPARPGQVATAPALTRHSGVRGKHRRGDAGPPPGGPSPAGATARPQPQRVRPGTSGARRTCSRQTRPALYAKQNETTPDDTAQYETCARDAARGMTRKAKDDDRPLKIRRCAERP